MRLSVAVALLAAAPVGASVCDIYDAAGTPCVAAHSLTRALYSAYSGRLYQVQRASDKATLNVNTVEVGGHADADAHVRVSRVLPFSHQNFDLTPGPPNVLYLSVCLSVYLSVYLYPSLHVSISSIIISDTGPLLHGDDLHGGDYLRPVGAQESPPHGATGWSAQTSRRRR